MRFILIATTAALLLSGCASPTDSSGRTLTIEDAGPAPTSPLEIVKAALLTRLKDPDSAQVKIVGTPFAQVVKSSPLMGVNGGAGWGICSLVNGKNSYGGYTGYKPVYLLWSNGQVLNYLDGDFGEIACRGAGSR